MSKKNNHKLKGGAFKSLRSLFRSKINHGPSMNAEVTVENRSYLKKRKYALNKTEEAIN